MPQLKRALVTGANRGLGLETVRQLEGHGFEVYATCREPGSKQVALDVADSASIAALVDRLTREGVELDVLVNNAGVALDGFDSNVVQKTLAVNFFGALAVSDALLPRLVPGANIVMVSSGLGEVSCLLPQLAAEVMRPTLTREQLVQFVNRFSADVAAREHRKRGWPSSAYNVSKVALNALTRIMARELAPKRIRVNAVCPGWVRTDMGGSAAPRGVAEGAASIIWAALLQDDTSGGFFRDGIAVDW